MAEPRTTETLVRIAQEGDGDALGELLVRFRPRLEAAVRARMGARLLREIEAADILQETFAWATKAIRRFQWRGEDSFYRWLEGIAGHMILKAAAKGRRSTVLSLERDVAGREVSPSKALRREERFDRLEEALDGLSPDDRAVILLARIEGLAVREIARRLGRSENAVMLLLSRALRKLRRRLSPTESLGLPDRALGGPGKEEASDGRR